MGYRLPLVTSVAIFLLLIAGSLVVGFKAGLACPDWPLCNGKVIPPLEGKVLIEYIHRTISLLVSLLMVWNGIVAWRKRKVSPLAARLTLLSFVLLLIVAGFGGINVMLKLPPGFTAIDVSFANLLFGTFVLITAVTYFQKKGGEKHSMVQTLTKPAMTASVIVFFQLVLGAFVEHSRAGAIVIQGQYRLLNSLIPSPVAAENVINLHLVANYAVAAGVLWFIFHGTLRKVFRWQRGILGLLLGLQMVAGFITVYSHLALYSTVIHLALASLMFAVCVWVTAQAKMGYFSL